MSYDGLCGLSYGLGTIGTLCYCIFNWLFIVLFQLSIFNLIFFSMSLSPYVYSFIFILNSFDIIHLINLLLTIHAKLNTQTHKPYLHNKPSVNEFASLPQPHVLCQQVFHLDHHSAENDK